jgi:glutamine amidotransferase
MLKKIGYSSTLTNDYDVISKSKTIIFPGVGNFDNVMQSIYEKKIDKAILNSLENNSKLLGICVGMQALFSRSAEGKLDGLNLIKGEIKKFKFQNKSFKVPHMGWNEVKFTKGTFKKNFLQNKFYFVHSYYAVCENQEDILGITNHSINFTACVKKKNIYGVQFHPEKSHYFGKKFFEIFLEND